MKDKDIDNLFKNAFDNHEAPLPADMWQRIQPGGNKKRRVVMWWQWYAAAAILLLAGMATWWFAGNQPVTAGKPEIAHLPTTTKPAAPSFNPLPQDQQTITRTKKDSAIAAAAHTRATGFTAMNEGKDTRDKQKTNLKEVQPALPKPSTLASHGEQATALPPTSASKKEENALLPAEPASKDDTAPALPAAPPQSANDAIAQAKDSSATLPLAPTAEASLPFASTQKEGDIVLDSNVQKIEPKTKQPWTVELLGATAFAHKQTYNVEKEMSRLMAAPLPLPQPKPVLWSYSAGVRLGIPVSQSFTIKTGLQYTRVSQEATYQQQNVVDMMTVSGTNDTTFYRQLFYQSEEHQSTVNALHIPVLLSYHTGKKTSVGVTGGLLLNAYSWYTGKVPNATYSATLDAAGTYRRRTGIALYAGLTVSRQVGAIQFFAEPYLQYSLGSITRPQVPFKQKINLYGLGIGVRTPLHR